MNRSSRRQAQGKTHTIRAWIAYASLALVVIAIISSIVFRNRVSKTAVELPSMSVPLLEGTIAPEITASTTAGFFDLSKTKSPVLIEVFATWCPHCQHETATLNALQKAYGSRAQIVAISGSTTAMDGQSPASQNDVLLFAERFGVKYPIAYDGTLDAAHKYLQAGFPSIVVLDARHRIVASGSGEISIATLRGWLHKAGV